MLIVDKNLWGDGRGHPSRYPIKPFIKRAHCIMPYHYIIIKPPESGELCEEITEFVVVEDHLRPLPPPQTK